MDTKNALSCANCDARKVPAQKRVVLPAQGGKHLCGFLELRRAMALAAQNSRSLALHAIAAIDPRLCETILFLKYDTK